ncbi:MAG: chemotaxis protein [Oceanospirillaceae bacterium]|nr:chemotaxis protein [Oceanospirillaceae bacterium]
MRWLTYPASLLLTAMGLKGVIGFHLFITCMGLITALIAAEIQSTPWLVVSGYLGSATLYLILSEVSDLASEFSKASGQAQRCLTSYPVCGPALIGVRSKIVQMGRARQELQQKLEEIAHSSHELEQSATQVTTSAEKQSDAASTASAAVEELDTGLREVAGLANSSLQSSLLATREIETSLEQLNNLAENVRTMSHQADQTDSLMFALNDASQTILSMSTVITSIADQTALLSLNAAIEAARAGDSGRGFSVVADEVRRLAIHCNESAQQISLNIDLVQSQIEQVGTHMAELKQIAGSSVAGADSVTALLEQARSGIHTLTTEVTQVATSTEQQSHAVREIAVLAECIFRPMVNSHSGGT